MEDQRDDCRADTVEDTGDRHKIAEIHIQRTQRSDDHDVRTDESRAASPGHPTYGYGFAHLLLGQPAALGDQFTFHLADQCNGTAEAPTRRAGENTKATR